jgi:hypothetical protein
VHHETAQIDVISRAVAQPFSSGKMRQVEFSGVLYGQHNRYRRHPIQRLCDVRREDAVGIDLRIVEKAIRGLELGSVERLRKRALRAAGEAARQGNKTPFQTCVAQVRSAELGVCPIVDIVLARQSRMPLQTGCAKVNIDAARLQAIFCLF